MAKKFSRRDVFRLGTAEDIHAALTKSPAQVGRALLETAARTESGPLRAVLSFAATPEEQSAGLVAACQAQQAENVQALLEAGVSPSPRGESYPLHEASAAGFSRGVARLLAAGADPNLPRPVPHFGSLTTHERPLYYAIKAQSLLTVRTLLQGKADPNAEAPDGFFLLDYAQEKNSPQNILEELKNAGAIPLPKEKISLSLLARNEDFAAFEKRCQDAPLDEVSPAFRIGVEMGCSEVVEMCLALPNFEPGPLFSAMRRACETDNKHLLRALLTRPVDWLQCPASESPLWTAAEMNWAPGLEILLAAGADPRLPGPTGKTVLEQVEQEGEPGCVAVLRPYGSKGKKRPPSLAEQLRKKIPQQKRAAWRPLFQAESALPGGSRFGGCPLLNPGETWPKNPGGKPLLFLAQLELSSLPAPHKGEGLFQFFIDESLPNGHKPGFSWLRVFSPLAKATVATPPPGARVFPVCAVRGWEEQDDVPSLPTLYRLFPALREADEATDDALRDEFRSLAGEKVGGWPHWIQNDRAGKEDAFLLQIDSEKTLPLRWGDAGIAFVFRLPDGSFDFLWECL
jgi:hypothetical protein